MNDIVTANIQYSSKTGNYYKEFPIAKEENS